MKAIIEKNKQIVLEQQQQQIKENPNHTKYAKKLVRTKNLDIIRDVELSGRCYNGSDYVESEKNVNREQYMLKKSRQSRRNEIRHADKLSKKILKNSRKESDKEFAFIGDEVVFRNDVRKLSSIMKQGGVEDAMSFIFDFVTIINNIYNNPSFIGYVTNICMFLKNHMDKSKYLTSCSGNIDIGQAIRVQVSDTLWRFGKRMFGLSRKDREEFYAWMAQKSPGRIPLYPGLRSIYLKEHFGKWIEHLELHIDELEFESQRTYIDNVKLALNSDILDICDVLTKNEKSLKEICEFLLQKLETHKDNPEIDFEFIVEQFNNFYKLFYNSDKLSKYISNYEDCLAIVNDDVEIDSDSGDMTQKQYANSFDEMEDSHYKLDEFEESKIEREGPDLKETIYGDVIKLVFKGDAKVFENSEFGKTSRHVLSSVTLAPFLMMTGKITTMKQYDEWYDANLKIFDISGSFLHHVFTWMYQLFATGIPYFISGDTTFLHPISSFEKWVELSNVVMSEVIDKQQLHEIAMKYSKQQLLKLIYVLIRTGREMITAFMMNNTVVAEAKIINMKLYRLIPTINAKYRSMDLKTAPMGILIYGKSGIGKSHIAQQVMAVCGSVLHLNTDKEIYNINSADKYMSGYIGQRIGYVDDMAGGVPDVNPDTFIMNSLPYFNEFNTATVQADVEDKGKIFNEMRLIVGTTNHLYLQCGSYVSEPDALLRRFGFIIEPKLKDKYKTKNAEDFKMTTEDIDMLDTHTFDIYTFRVGSNGVAVDHENADYQYVKFEDKLCKDVDSRVLMKVVKKTFEEFVNKGDKSKDRTKKILTAKWCEEHQMLDNFCSCSVTGAVINDKDILLPTEVMLNLRQINFSIFSEVTELSNVIRTLVSIMEDEKDNIIEDKRSLWDNIKLAKTKKNNRKNNIERQGYWKRFKSFLFSPIKNCVIAIIRDEEVQNNINDTMTNGVKHVVNTFTQPEPVDVAFKNITGNRVFTMDIRAMIENYKKELLSGIYSKLGTFGAIVTVLLATYQTLRMFLAHPVIERQAGFFTRIPKENYIVSYKAIDAQLGALMDPEPYFPTERVPTHKAITPLSMAPIEKNKTQSNLNKITDTNLYEIKVHQINANNSGDGYALVLGRNIAVFPKHYLFNPLTEKYEYDIRVYFTNPKQVTTVHTYNRRSIYIVPNRDLVAVHFPDLPHFALTAIMGKENIITSEAFIVVPNDQAFDTAKYRLAQVNLTAKTRKDQGDELLEYNSGVTTMRGYCGLPVLSLGKYSGIVGIHTGVNTDDRTQKYITRLYDTDLEDFSKKLFAQSGVVSMLSLPPGGIEYQGNVTTLSEKSKLRYFQGFGFPLGTVEGVHAPRLKSRIKLSRFAVESCALEKYKIPHFQSYTRERQDGETEFVDATIRKLRTTERSPRDINPGLLQATMDTFSKVIDSWVDWDEVRPSSFSDIMNGQEGTISNSLNLSTAPGYGYDGKKRDFVYELQSDPLDRVFDEKVMSMVVAMLHAYRNKIIGFAVSKWFPKDEPISIAKELDGKQRFVSCSPFHKIIVSKMVLKDLFLKMRQRRKCHMCVGMNAASFDWGSIPAAMAKLDPKFERVMDGDYSAYDCIAWFLIIVLSVLLMKLANNKYFKEEIHIKFEEYDFKISAYEILECLISDIHAYPVLIGLDLAMLFGILESGADHTAELNSLMETFIHIMIYLFTFVKFGPHEFSDFKLDVQKSEHTSLDLYDLAMSAPYFDDNVVLRNYGDDSIDTCSLAVSEFYSPKNRGLAAAALGFPITDARKNKQLSYVSLKEATFLKRRFIWNDEAQAYFAPLERESIMKILAFIRTENCTIEEASINNLCDAQRQFFMYGREIFEKETLWLRELVTSKKEFVGVDIPWVTFDQLLADFKAAQLSMGSL